MSGEAETTMAALSGKATYGGSAVAGVGWLTSNEGLAFCGLVVGFFGLLVQFYYAKKKDRREERESDLRIRLMQESHEEIKP